MESRREERAGLPTESGEGEQCSAAGAVEPEASLG